MNVCEMIFFSLSKKMKILQWIESNLSAHLIVFSVTIQVIKLNIHNYNY
jgi:hypothetical protein